MDKLSSHEHIITFIIRAQPIFFFFNSVVGNKFDKEMLYVNHFGQGPNERKVTIKSPLSHRNDVFFSSQDRELYIFWCNFNQRK